MNTNEHYTDINARTVDSWVESGWEWGKPVDEATCLRARNGEWDVLLTPNKPVPHAWFGELKGKKLLGLACGGGQQMPVFSLLGADCTVLDYSQKQLENEQLVAEREGYDIAILRADMTKPLPFADDTFDMIFQPVSNCYVENMRPIFKECLRILKPGGVFIGGFDNGICFAFDEDEPVLRYRLPFNPLQNPEHRAVLEKDNSGMQFSHTTEEIISGQLEAGFVLTNLYEDTDNYGKFKEFNLPVYLATRAIKPGR